MKSNKQAIKKFNDLVEKEVIKKLETVRDKYESNYTGFGSEIPNFESKVIYEILNKEISNLSQQKDEE